MYNYWVWVHSRRSKFWIWVDTFLESCGSNMGGNRLKWGWDKCTCGWNFDIVIKLRVVLASYLGKTTNRCGWNMGRNRLKWVLGETSLILTWQEIFKRRGIIRRGAGYPNILIVIYISYYKIFDEIGYFLEKWGSWGVSRTSSTSSRTPLFSRTSSTLSRMPSFLLGKYLDIFFNKFSLSFFKSLHFNNVDFSFFKVNFSYYNVNFSFHHVNFSFYIYW